MENAIKWALALLVGGALGVLVFGKKESVVPPPAPKVPRKRKQASATPS